MEKQIVRRSCIREIPALHTLLVQEYIENCEKITISLQEGSAEIFGMELMKNYPHSYYLPCSLPVFSWDHAEIKIEWSELENTKNSESEWIDITKEAGNNESKPMVEYLEFHYEMVGLRKIALEEVKEGPRIAIVGNARCVPQNVGRLLLNYSGKYNMNPMYVDLDPESTIFVDGSIGVMEFDYKICEDLFDRPDKLCFYYGQRIPHSKSYFSQVRFLMETISKKLAKEMKEYKSQGTEEEHPFFSNGMIIQCPRVKDSSNSPNKIDQFVTLTKLIDICRVTHVVSVGCPEFLTYLSQEKVKVKKMEGAALEGSEGFLGLPRPVRSKIERYFDRESKKKTFKIDDIRLYELMTETASTPFTCRLVNIREEAISKNTIAVLHAKVGREEKLELPELADRIVDSPICCLAHIFSIEENEITLEVGQESFLEDFRDNIWVTSVLDQ